MSGTAGIPVARRGRRAELAVVIVAAIVAATIFAARPAGADDGADAPGSATPAAEAGASPAGTAALPSSTVDSIALHDNGGLAPIATSESGVAAPAGSLWSEVQHNTGDTTNANINAGFSSSVAFNRLADDFTVPAGQTWTIDAVDTLAYLTNGPPASPFSVGVLQIWQGRPGDVGSTVLFGDLATNRLVASTDTGLYRIWNTVAPPPGQPTSTSRRIFNNTLAVAPALVFGAGTYWIEWATDVSTVPGANHFTPSVTVAGTRTVAGWNARQFVISSSTWINANDPGDPGTAPDVAQDMPFKVRGTATCSGTPANDLFACATALAGLSGQQTGTTVGAAAEPSEPVHHSGQVNASVWYWWTAPAAGDVTFQAWGSTDHVMAAYEGDALAALQGLGSDDNSGPGSQPVVSFTADLGTTYFIAVDPRGSLPGGSFQLRWNYAVCDDLPVTIEGSGGINGTGGDDTILGSAGADTIHSGAGNDVVCGGDGDDTIFDGLGADIVFGDVGNDTFVQGANPTGDADDRIEGGTGADGVSYEARSGAVNIVANGNPVSGAANEDDSVRSVTKLIGGDGDDTMQGSTKIDHLVGGGGADEIFGGAGNDKIKGGSGDDELHGDAGGDKVTGDGGADYLDLVDGVVGNDTGNGSGGTDTADIDPGDTLINVP